MSVEDILRNAERAVLRAEADAGNPEQHRRHLDIARAWCEIAQVRTQVMSVRGEPREIRNIRAALRARASRGIF